MYDTTDIAAPTRIPKKATIREDVSLTKPTGLNDRKTYELVVWD
jgi:hypothetical protein